MLTDAEIRELFSRDSMTAKTMQLCLLTGQRNGEYLIQNKQISGHWWTIAASDYKTGVVHRVYLSGAARRLILLLEPPKKVETLSQKCRAWGVTWNPHDLRRTMATRLGDLDFSDEHIQRLLGHAVGKISSTYNRRKYDEQKRRLAISWAWELRRILKS